MQHATQVSKNCIATFRGEFFGDPRASPPRAPTDRIAQEPGYALRSALGVTRETQVPSRPCHSFINEGAPEARPIAREGVAWSGRLVASHFAGIGRDSNPRPSASCCVPRFVRQFGLAFRTYHELGAAVLLGGLKAERRVGRDGWIRFRL